MGSRNKPFYRIVAVDSRLKRDGKYLENIGHYDPKTEPFTLKIDTEKAIKWLSVGAQPSETVRSFFKKAGILQKWHEMRHQKDEPVPAPGSEAEEGEKE
jgi:small subunit ribosomal protein S16